MNATGVIFKAHDNRIAVKLDSVGFKEGDIIQVWDGKIRSLRANRYYWAMLNWIVKPTGGDLFSQGCLSPLDLHEDFKAYYGIETTTNLDNKEFSRYIEVCKVVCGQEFCIDISIFEEIHGTYAA